MFMFFLTLYSSSILSRSTDTAVWKILSYEDGTGTGRLFCDDSSSNGLIKRYQEPFLVVKLLSPHQNKVYSVSNQGTGHCNT